MASGKVARRADAGEIASLLDSPEIAALIDRLGSVGDSRGRKGYGARALVGACLVKALYGLPTWTRVASLRLGRRTTRQGLRRDGARIPGVVRPRLWFPA